MRRFGQFIRQAGHFGKLRQHLSNDHRNGRGLPAGAAMLPGTGSLSPLSKESRKGTFEMDNELQLRRMMTLFFALLSGASAVSFAVLPSIF
jgi:hypothetical protein